MQHERYLATGKVRDEGCEETQSEMPINMSEASYDKVREFYGEIHEPYNDDIYEVKGKVRQPHDEEYDEMYEAHEAVTNVKRTVGTINAIEVDKTK